MAQFIDTHTHFFDPYRPKGVPWPNRENTDLYRTTLPEHFSSVASIHGVTRTVVIEASPWIEDNQWIIDLADDPTHNPEQIIAGFIGNLRPQDVHFYEHLDRFSANPLFRGIRLGSTAIAEIGHAKLIALLRELSSRDLTVDLIIAATELSAIAGICESAPEAHVVIDHVGHVAIDGEKPDQTWYDGMQALSKMPYVFCKISGLVENAIPDPAPTKTDFYRPTLDALWEHFGTKRLLYASNWPVCRKGGSYSDVFTIAQSYVENHNEEAINLIFHDNAVDCYRLPDLQ